MRHKIVLLVMIGSIIFASCVKSSPPKQKKYNWNNGYCEICGGRLDYSGTGNKEHYICEICGKEYTFDGVMSRK